MNDTAHRLRTEWERLRDRYYLDGWRFILNTRMSSCGGRCKHERRQVHVAAWVIDTLRHEVAHAIAGPGVGHGPRWQKWARILGASPTACLPWAISQQSPKRQRGPKWALYCTGCRCTVGTRYRRERGTFRHLACGGGEIEWHKLR